MSSQLNVQNLGKSYRQWGSEWRRVASWFSPFIRPREEHWVLKEINFSENVLIMFSEISFRWLFECEMLSTKYNYLFSK